MDPYFEFIKLHYNTNFFAEINYFVKRFHLQKGLSTTRTKLELPKRSIYYIGLDRSLKLDIFNDIISKTNVFCIQ